MVCSMLYFLCLTQSKVKKNVLVQKQFKLLADIVIHSTIIYLKSIIDRLENCSELYKGAFREEDQDISQESKSNLLNETSNGKINSVIY